MSDSDRRRRRPRSSGDADAPEAAAPTRRAAPGDAEGRREPSRAGRDERRRPAPQAGRDERRRPTRASTRAPSPSDLAERGGAFAQTFPVHDPEAAFGPDGQAERGGDETPTERGLRGLVGGGGSQVDVRSAMRARDAARPTEEDLAAAEEHLTIVRRGWVPREELPRPPRR